MRARIQTYRCGNLSPTRSQVGIRQSNADGERHPGHFKYSSTVEVSCLFCITITIIGYRHSIALVPIKSLGTTRTRDVLPTVSVLHSIVPVTGMLPGYCRLAHSGYVGYH